MIPSSLAAVAIFVLVFLPGLVLERLRQRHRPALKRTTLEELAGVLVAGLAITLFALSVVAVIRVIRPEWMPDAGRWLEDPALYFRTHYRLVLRTAALEFLIAAITVGALERSLNQPPNMGIAHYVTRVARQALREDPESHIEPYPLLWTIVRTQAGRGRIAVASIKLKDGRRVTGRVSAFSPEAVGDGLDIALETPVDINWPDGPATTLGQGDTTGSWKFFIVRGPEIVEMAVRYDDLPPKGNE